MSSLLLGVIYLSFISLGLPDSLLGSAWPSIYPQLGVPVSYAGILSMIIAAGTVISSLQSDRLTRRFGTGRVTAFSVALTAAALFGFSRSGAFWQLALWAIPYGLGAGSVDASLNNYVALHYASRHMSWLHAMWGVGASTGPYIMAFALTGGLGWTGGYGIISLLQMALTAVLLFSLPLWGKQTMGAAPEHRARKALSTQQVLCIPGAAAFMVTFFCYCALEQTTGLWAGSYLTLHGGLSAEAAAGYSALFYLGITAGRVASGFLTFRLSDTQMVRLGQAITCVGVVSLLSFRGERALPGLVLIGLGCAPVYPCLIHSTPRHFGAQRSQAVIGVQMACAYVGTCVMPPVFGVLAQRVSPALLPVFLLVLLAVMFTAHERLLKRPSVGPV